MMMRREHARRRLHSNPCGGFVAACLLIVTCSTGAMAGGGPENVAVVVNAESWASMAIANEFVHLRGIPSGNTVYLKDVPDIERTDVETFRERILKPVLQALTSRGLRSQIDCIAYSSDLPWRVNVTKDRKETKLPKVITPQASINGLTYLLPHVGAKSLAYLDLNINYYARRAEPSLAAAGIPRTQAEAYKAALQLMTDKNWAEAETGFRAVAESAPGAPELLYNLACSLARQDDAAGAMEYLRRAVEAGFLHFTTVLADEDLKPLRDREDFKSLVERMKTRVFDVQPTRGFRSTHKWGREGQVGASGGPSYLLSTMLGVTSGRGNSVREVVEGLRRSVAADGTKPEGTIYFMVNGDIRSRTRQWGFASAAAKLRELGVRAEIIDGKLPKDCDDVMGLMAGSAGFDWKGCGSTILPGAICEHLTSTGGVLTEGAKQTPLTEFIRFGAAGASGTVTEPYAIQAKFPDPFIHVHYARGCTLAEAFYQSVHGPYQLLIVGDPLCRPWADIPVVSVRGIEPGADVRDRISMHPGVADEPAHPVGRYELFVDGKRLAVCRPGERIDWDTRAAADGYHEIRIVAVSADLIETRGALTVPVFVNNRGHRLEVTPAADATVPWGGTVRIDARLPGALEIALFHNRRVMGVIKGEAGGVDIDTRGLGIGPVELQAIGIVGDPKSGDRVVSEPVAITVAPPPSLPPVEIDAVADFSEGLLLSPDGAERVVIESTKESDWLAKAGVKEGESFSLVGHFEAPAEDVYQFQIRTDGEVSVEVSGTTVGKASGGKWRLLPVALKAGTHKLTIRGTAGARQRLSVRFGGPGAFSVGADRFRHL